MSTTQIDALIQQISRLPGLGPRSARRIVLFLIKKKMTHMQQLISLLQDVSTNAQTCPVCGNVDTQIPCSVCQDSKRNAHQLCIVADVADLWALERSNVYHGQYHVLGGVLSALDGIGPEELNLSSLSGRLSKGDITEVILALPATVDGQTTALFISDMIKQYHVCVSALSHGVPMGGELDYLDDGTLQTAFTARRQL